MDGLGMRLKELRKSLGYTQEQLANILGIDHGHVSKIEKGKGGASTILLRHICNELSVSMIWLANGEGEIFLPPEEVIKKQIARLGERAFYEALRKLDDSPAVLMEESGAYWKSKNHDPDFEHMINFLNDLWTVGDENLKAWAKVQFARAFPPDVEEEVEKKRAGKRNRESTA